MACLQHYHAEQWDCSSCTSERQKGASQAGSGIPIEWLCPAVERIGGWGSLILWPITTLCAVVWPLLMLARISLAAFLIYWLSPELYAVAASHGAVVYIVAMTLGVVVISWPARVLLHFIPSDYGVVKGTAVGLITLVIFLAAMRPFAPEVSKATTEFRKTFQPQPNTLPGKGHTSVAKKT
ncbi:MAG TPA: hypothetical protein VNX26_16110 [Candidatus Acidoferrum sp.]|jgi:hypothetical protein|nr:hypothetical protein [Candidatus Acidoferrum sp.]